MPLASESGMSSPGMAGSGPKLINLAPTSEEAKQRLRALKGAEGGCVFLVFVFLCRFLCGRSADVKTVVDISRFGLRRLSHTT